MVFVNHTASPQGLKPAFFQGLYGAAGSRALSKTVYEAFQALDYVLPKMTEGSVLPGSTLIITKMLDRARRLGSIERIERVVLGTGLS